MRTGEDDKRVRVGDGELHRTRQGWVSLKRLDETVEVVPTLYLMFWDLTTNPTFCPVRMSFTSAAGRGGDNEDRNDSRAVSKKDA